MSDRQGTAVLVLLGFTLVVAGFLIDEETTRVTLCVLGAALTAFAVALPRLVAFKLGATGLEGELQARQDVVQRSEAVGETLDRQGLDLTTIATGGRALEQLSTAIQGEIRRQVEELAHAVRRVDDTAVVVDPVPTVALIELARGSMATGDWHEAAEYLDRYVRVEPDDWEVHFTRAVAHANARTDEASHLDALRAYNDALALRPADLDENLTARLFSYRGAMLKRLKRLDEAEADLRNAEKLASSQYELTDITYNRACVAAMAGRRDDALTLVRRLRGTDYIGAVRAHLDDYFASMADDPDFLAVIDES